MKPEVDKVLLGFSDTLIEKIMPHVGMEYVQRDVTLLSLALMASAEEYDRAADIRFSENKDMREIFAAVAERIEGDLGVRLKEAGRSSDRSLRISALNDENVPLRKLLIELHAFVEESNDDWAPEIDALIWKALHDSTQRRALSFFPF